jgi:hypothetical protein
MRKNTLTILGILSLLLAGLALSSAASPVNNFNITIDGAGVSGTTPVRGTAGSDVNFNVKFETTNTSYQSGIKINWSGEDISPGNLSNIGNRTFSPTIKIGTGSSHILKVTVTDDNGVVLADLGKSVYYSTSAASSSKSYCERDYPSTGEKGSKLELELDITNNGKGDSDEWQYLDEIRIDVTVVNDDNDDVDDMTVELMILDKDGKEVSRKDIGLDKDKDDIGDVKDDDEETATFKIDKMPVDMDDGKYYLYAMAYSDGDEEHFCVSKSDDYSNSADTYYEFSIEAG